MVSVGPGVTYRAQVTCRQAIPRIVQASLKSVPLMAVCPDCNAQPVAGDSFCQKCGARLDFAGANCTGCGKRLPIGANWCPYCAAPRKGRQATPAGTNTRRSDRVRAPYPSAVGGSERGDGSDAQ